MKKLSYLFPTGDPSELKIFEDNTSTIRGHYFKRSTYKELKQFENTDSACIYFLLYSDSDDINHIYIGQSVNGFNRIDNHNLNKGDWTEGYLFNSTNRSWSKTIIDFLEYHYIEIFKSTIYDVENTGGRVKPVLNIYEQADINKYIECLDFLLTANDIIQQKKEIIRSEFKIYKNDKYNASLIREDGMFILLKDSEIKRPSESAKNSKSGSKYRSNDKKIDELIKAGRIALVDDKLIAQENIEFKKPSRPACFASGGSENGWEFWNIIDR